MNDERDPPIESPGFIAGVTVVDIGDIRVARGLTRRHYSSCPHRRMMYDLNERRVWCRDCEKDVEGFDAFRQLVEGYYDAIKLVERREKAISDAEKFKIRTIAAKTIDVAWRSRNMVPACPHCHNGLFPEDFKREPDMLSKEYANARRGKKRQP